MSAASSPSAAALPPSQSQSQSVSALLRQIRSAVPLRTHSDFDALFHVRHPGDGTSSSSFSVVVPEQLETEDTQDLTGLHPGHVLHLTGPPGSGKSQLCASFALHLPLDQPGCQVLILGLLSTQSTRSPNACDLAHVSFGAGVPDSSDGVLGPQELIRRSSHRFTSEGWTSFSLFGFCSPSAFAEALHRHQDHFKCHSSDAAHHSSRASGHDLWRAARSSASPSCGKLVYIASFNLGSRS